MFYFGDSLQSRIIQVQVCNLSNFILKKISIPYYPGSEQAPTSGAAIGTGKRRIENRSYSCAGECSVSDLAGNMSDHWTGIQGTCNLLDLSLEPCF